MIGKAQEMGIHKQDVALDWLSSRGYRILDNLRKSGGAGGAASAGEGASVEPAEPGSLRMRLFGAPVEADFQPGSSSLDTDGGFLQVAVQTNCQSLLDPPSGSAGAPGTSVFTAARFQNQYCLDLRKEIQEYLATGGPWSTRAFEAGARK